MLTLASLKKTLASIPLWAYALAGTPLIAAAFTCWQPDWMLKVFVHTSYYFMLALVVTWVYVLSDGAKPTMRGARELWRAHWPAIVGALLVTLIVTLSVDSFYRVLSDETNLLSVSQSFTFNKTVHNATVGQWVYENFHEAFVEIEKRPLLFPFVLSLVHSVTGYRYENAFYLNNALLFVLLICVYAFVNRFAKRPIALAAMFAVAAQPIVIMSATCGGFDLMNAACFIASMICLVAYQEKPSPRHLALLWMFLLIATNIRYENSIYLAVVPLVLLIIKKLRWQDVRPYIYVYALTPLFLLPRFWQSWLKQGTYENPPGVPLFSAGHLWEHSLEMVKAIGRFDFFLPYNPLLNVVGCLTLAVVALRLVTKGIKRAEVMRFGPVALCVLINVTIFLAHHAGHFIHPTQARFFVILVIFLSILAVLAVQDLFEGKMPFLAAASVILFVVYLPVAGESKFSNALTIIRQTKQLYAYFKQHDDHRVVVVTDAPNHFTVLNYGSMSFDYFHTHQDEVLHQWQNRLFQEVYFVQKIKLPTMEPVEKHKVDASIKSKTLMEFQNTPDEIIRLARVDSFTPSPQPKDKPKGK